MSRTFVSLSDEIGSSGCVQHIGGSGTGTRVHIARREQVAATMPYRKRVQATNNDCTYSTQSIVLEPMTTCPGELLQDVSLQVMKPALALTIGKVEAATTSTAPSKIAGSFRAEITSAGIDTIAAPEYAGSCPVDQESLCLAAGIHQSVIDAAKDYLRPVHIEDMQDVFRPFLSGAAKVVDPRGPQTFPADATAGNARYLHMSAHLKVIHEMMFQSGTQALNGKFSFGLAENGTTSLTAATAKSFLFTKEDGSAIVHTIDNSDGGAALGPIARAALYLVAIQNGGIKTDTEQFTAAQLRQSPSAKMAGVVADLLVNGATFLLGDGTANVLADLASDNKAPIMQKGAREFLGAAEACCTWSFAPLFATAFVMHTLGDQGLTQGMCFPVYEPRFYNNWVDSAYKSLTLTPKGSSTGSVIQEFHGLVERVHHVENVGGMGLDDILEAEEHYKSGNYHPPRHNKADARKDHARQCFDARQRQSIKVPCRPFMKDIHSGLHHGLAHVMFGSLQLNVTVEQNDFAASKFVRGAARADVSFDGATKASFHVASLDVVGPYTGVARSSLGSDAAVDNELQGSRYWECPAPTFKGCLMYVDSTDLTDLSACKYAGIQLAFGKRRNVPTANADTQHQSSGLITPVDVTVNLHQGDDCPGELVAKDYELHALMEGTICPELGKQFSALVADDTAMTLDVGYGDKVGEFSQRFNYAMLASKQETVDSGAPADHSFTAPVAIGECLHVIIEGPTGSARVRANPCPWDFFSKYANSSAASVSGGSQCNEKLGRVHSDCHIEIVDKLKAQFANQDEYRFSQTANKATYYKPTYWYADSLQINPRASIHRLQCRGLTNFPGIARSIRVNLGRVPANLAIMEQGIRNMNQKQFTVGLDLEYNDVGSTAAVSHRVQYVIRGREEILFTRDAKGKTGAQIVTSVN